MFQSYEINNNYSYQNSFQVGMFSLLFLRPWKANGASEGSVDSLLRVSAPAIW